MFDNLTADLVSAVTPDMLAQLCRVPDRDANESLLYFASERIGLFRMVFGLYDHSGDWHELPDAEIHRYLTTMVPPIDPDTGFAVADTSSIIMYFRGTPSLVALLKERR